MEKLLFLFLSLFFINCSGSEKISSNSDCIVYEADIEKVEVRLYWKDQISDRILANFDSLNKYVESRNTELVFAMNGGMFHKDFSPVGLYVENSKILMPLDTTTGNGNFYLKPNGVFYIAKGKMGILTTEEYKKENLLVDYATQSGPMLLINGNIHPSFNEQSTNKNIRNGVGILPNGNPVFVISTVPINFYTFANFFRELGCKEALYLDGYISKIYYPEKNYLSEKEKFGVMIGISKHIPK